VSTLPDTDMVSERTAAKTGLLLVDDARGWTVVAPHASDGARMRHAFRDYLEHFGHPASDFAAAEAVYGELINTCVRHAPGEIRIEFSWDDSTLVVVDTRDRLRLWPFSDDDPSAENTHHAYALISAYTGRIHVERDAAGGTRASVVLPVMPAML
jgi:hypothetical protein